jgi:hypothetical protein
MDDDKLWWQDHRNLATLANDLIYEEGYTAQDLVDLLNEPWHWYSEWKAAEQRLKENV